MFRVNDSGSNTYKVDYTPVVPGNVLPCCILFYPSFEASNFFDSFTSVKDVAFSINIGTTPALRLITKR